MLASTMTKADLNTGAPSLAMLMAKSHLCVSEVSTKDSLLERGMSVALTGAVCLRTGLISSVLLRFDLDRTASAGLTVETAWELDPAAP